MLVKRWITRYALTEGILELDGTLSTSGTFRHKPESGFDLYFHGKDVHETRELAIARAEEMRIAKLKSLDKSIVKISKLKF